MTAPTGSSIPEDLRAAIHAGMVTEIVVYCDSCGLQTRGDYVGADAEHRMYAARTRLSQRCGWKITEASDLCPLCVHEIRFCAEGEHGDWCAVQDGDWTDLATGDRVHPDDVDRYTELLELATSRQPRFIPFMLDYLAGLTTDIDDCVDQWHELPPGPERVVPTLAEYLGFTDEQYATWVSTGRLPERPAPPALSAAA